MILGGCVDESLIGICDDVTGAGLQNYLAWLYSDCGAAHLANEICWALPNVAVLMTMKTCGEWKGFCDSVLYGGGSEEQLQNPLAG